MIFSCHILHILYINLYSANTKSKDSDGDGFVTSFSNATICWPTVKNSPLCWWVWLLLLLLLLLCCICFGFMYIRFNRPRIFVRLYKAGTSGYTIQDEKIFTVYVKDDYETIQSIVDKLSKMDDVPSYIINQLKFDRTMDLYHQQHSITTLLGCLNDYDIKPLKSNKAPGKTRKLKIIRMEEATIDIKKGVMTANPLREYSPRTKISMMSRMNHVEDDVEKSLKGVSKIRANDLAGTGLVPGRSPTKSSKSASTNIEMTAIPTRKDVQNEDDANEPAVVGIAF